MAASKYRTRYSQKVVTRSIRRSTQAASTGVCTALVLQLEAAPLYRRADYEKSLRGL